MGPKTIREAKKLLAAVFGVTLVLVGVAMIVTPGPGLLTILAGLALLGTEYAWARRLLKRLKHDGNEIKDSVFGRPKPASAKPETGGTA